METFEIRLISTNKMLSTGLNSEEVEYLFICKKWIKEECIVIKL